jgi:spore germination protein KC
MKKTGIYVIFIMLLLLFGCGSYKEITDVRAVTAIAIDVGTEEIPYTISYEVLDRAETKGGPTRAVTLVSEGRTIFEAARKAVKNSTAKLFFGHCGVMIFGEELAKRGLGDILDFFLRDPDFSFNMDLVVAKGIKAKELLSHSTFLVNVAAYEIRDTIKNDEKYTSMSRITPLYTAFEELISSGVELSLPAFSLTTVMNKPTFELSGLAIFKEDKLQEYLDGETVKYYLLIRGLLKGGVIPIDFKEHGYMTFEIEKLDGNTSFKFSDEKNTVRIDVKGVGFLGENQTDLENGMITYKEVEKVLESQLTNGLRDFFRRYIESDQPDVLALGRNLRKFHYRTWEKHQKDFAEFIKTFDVDITVDIIIENSGLGEI